MLQVEQLKEEICEYQRSERPEPPPAEGVRVTSLQVFPRALSLSLQKNRVPSVSQTLAVHENLDILGLEDFASRGREMKLTWLTCFISERHRWLWNHSVLSWERCGAVGAG